MRAAFMDHGQALCDADLVTIIGNSKAPLNKKTDMISHIANQTRDNELKDSLDEWIQLAKSSKSKKKLESLSEKLFDSRFVNFMTPFVKGDVVKMARDDTRHGILMQGGMIIPEKELQNRVGKLDYSDVQFRVEWLGDDGKFYHEHVNPLYLDCHAPREGDIDYGVLMEASLLVRGDEGSSLQGFQMACEEYVRNSGVCK
jgi:hypothetical protein